jgi:hypothetical protein
MPIEIRELIIKTTVDPNANSQGSPPIGGEEEKHALIQECVDQVMAILKEKSER